MVTIKDKEYDSFRKNVDMIITETPNINQTLLKKLMRDKGFHSKRQIDYDKELEREVKYSKNYEPTELQLNIAWDYIQTKGINKRDLTITRYRTEKYKSHTIKRMIGIKEVEYKGKKYKKGQFLPKNYED